MRTPSVSIVLIALASWTCGGGDSSGTPTPPAPTPTTGTLMVSVSGLPAGASAQGSITGPGGFNASLTGPQSFPGLVPGLYTVTPTTVSSSGTTYISGAQNGNVVAGQTANVGVTYSRLENPLLSVVGGGTGTGSGHITSSPAGIDCTITNGTATGSCSVAFPRDTTVQLIVAQGTLTGWASDCTGTAGCTVSMSQTRQVIATFAVIPIIVINTTKPVIVASRTANDLTYFYSIKNGGGGAWAPTASAANPATWSAGSGIQVSVVGDGANTKLQVHIEAQDLLPYSESKTPYVASTVISTPGADPVTVTITYAKTFDQPAGMAATIVRFHRQTGDSPANPPSNLAAMITLFDARTASRLVAKVLQVDPPGQNWLATPSINSTTGQLIVQVKGYDDTLTQIPAGLPGSGSNFGTPVRISLGSADGSTTCPALVVGPPPDPSCQVFVYYDSDPFSRLILSPWGVQLTPSNPTAIALVGRQSRSPDSLAFPTLLANDCGNRLASQPTFASGQIMVAGNFAALNDDETFRCTVSIGATYFDDKFVPQGTDIARLLVTLVKPTADAITPSQRDLNILATAGVASPDSSTIDLSNLGPNSIAVKAPTFDGASISGNPPCPAALLSPPTITGTSIGHGNTATVTVRINPQNQPSQVCSATLGLHATGAPDQSIPVIIRLK
jgi:hypothetical protein